ncbi:tigger transposable element-derived protein 6-like [Rhipicephalus sanguineus]|uniref:tigger transposable element-derived protein 6-like n=1 Tax=Rhipicephalus sanguineus TaxID=34632 RepID=UPI001893801F|nr:tigger transposable element-derived protein 6-like [Rhipicephalus sanguineus]
MWKTVCIAKELGLTPSTLNSIVAKRIEIEENARTFDVKCKQARSSEHVQLDKAVFEWFKQARAAGVNFDGTILREKALEIADKLGLKDYEPRDIFNADEAGLFFKVQPSKTLSLKGEACHGGKCSKERLTVLLCCNSDGSEMMKPWVIGKFRNPRCLKNIRHLPCHYNNNTKAWMTCSLFEEFLRYMDSKMGCQNRKVILFLDNCSTHPKDTASLRNVKVVFLPANTTSHLQPLDAGIIKNVKHFYRKCIVKRSLASVERGQQPAGVTILDAMHYLASAWSAVTAATVEHCFNKCFGVRADDTTEAVGDGAFADCDELNTAMETVGASGIAYSDYASVDDAVVTSAMLSVDDIVAECASDEEVEEEEEVEEVEVERIPEPTFSSAVAALDLLRRYVRTSDDGESHMALQVLEKRLVLVGREKMRQATLHDFFKRKN